MSNVVIVGGGASGLTAGIFAAKQGHKVIILEHKDKIGKKILATGNGKCNYTNLVQLPECYRSNDSTFPMKVLSIFGVHETIDFFRQLGIHPKEREGYVYPNSEQAASVVQVLEMKLKELKVNVCLDVHVEHIQKVKNAFKLNTNKGDFTADKVILAAGGCASPNHGSDGSGYLLAKELGHKLVKPLPALVQLKSKEKYFKTLAGVRTEAYIQLFVNDRFAAEEKGELLIANYGVSGIPIFQLSRFAAKAINENRKVTLKIDFLPSLNWKETFDLITERMNNNPKKTAKESMVGLFNNKLAFVMLKEAGIESDLFCEKVNKKHITDLVNQIKEWKIPISETNSFEQAQVSAGGVDTAEITPTTMESKRVKGLYLTGELVDVDGTCGGYNLQWAWSTGAVAGMNL
jgi:predicted Rossmann fold flavoprotein